MDIQSHPNDSNENQEFSDLPQCKIKRNYSCGRCSYFTQNPRFYLTHLRDTHGERITISKCSLCLYASRHYQKLVRHMKMVHGSSSEDIPGQSRKRPIIDEVVSDITAMQMPPLPLPPKWIIDIDNWSYDLKSSRKTIKDFAAVYFAENEIADILTKMEESDVVEVVPVLKELPSIGISPQKVFNDPKCVDDKDLDIHCPCGYVSKGFLDLIDHGKSCSETNKTNCCNSALDLSLKWSSSDVVSSTPKKEGAIGVLKIDDEALDKNTFGDYIHDSKALEKKLTQEDIKSGFQEELTKIQCISMEDINTSHKKVFKCPLCPFWATTASRFHVHIVGHQNKKQFKCSMCAYCSNWRWDITKHIRLRSLRGINHKNARVLMLGEHLNQNYTKYDRFITHMKIPSQEDCFKLKKSQEQISNSNNMNSKEISVEGNKNQLHETAIDINGEERILKENRNQIENIQPPNPLNSKISSSIQSSPRNYVVLEHSDQPAYRCIRCNFRHSNRDAVLVHVKIHHQELLGSSTIPSKLVKTPTACFEDSKIIPCEKLEIVDVENEKTIKNDPPHPKKTSTTHASNFKESLGSNKILTKLIVDEKTKINNNDKYAPFRCWHCHQVSNWKHVIQRHCRLKHSGSIRIEAIDRSIDSNNPSYRMLNLSSSPSVTLLDESQSGRKTDKQTNQSIKHETVSNYPEAQRSTPIDSKKSKLNFKTSEKEDLKHSSLISKNTHEVTTAAVGNDISEKLQKCMYCSFASSCHSAMKCHEQSHYKVQEQKDSQIGSLNTIKGIDDCGKILSSSKSENTKIVTGKRDQLEIKDVNIEMDMKESLGNLKDSETNHEVNKIQLKIKHNTVTTTTSTRNVNLKNYKMAFSQASNRSIPKTIFVNPKTGQIVRRN